MTDKNYLRNLRVPTPENPLRILISGCLTGILCAWDESDNGNFDAIRFLRGNERVKLIPFCPEDYAYGTPRALSDIHGGNGSDVWNGTAKVLTEAGEDWTDGMKNASQKMLEIGLENEVELALLLDISAACGSQTIYLGNRRAEKPVYQMGMGVCAAHLHNHGIKIISQRDFASLEILHSRIDPDYQINPQALDHDQTEWFQSYFQHSPSL